MPPVFKFSADYRRKSRETIEQALTQGAYQEWNKYDTGSACNIDERYAAMPALTKADIRVHFPHGLVPPGRNIQAGLAEGHISYVNTSGSSDAKVTNIWNQRWWDSSEKYSWQLNNHALQLATGSHHEAILVNPRNVGISSDDKDLPMGRRQLGHFLYLNEKTDPTAWSSALMDRMIAELGMFKPALLEANPSYLARLCRYAAAAGKTIFQPGLIVLTYELPSRLQLRHIHKIFSTPITSSYGSTETGYVFMQCEQGRFHQNTASCRVDLEPLKIDHGGPDVCRILVTTFDNEWYTMVRFDVGDLATIEPSGSCPCGRDDGFILSTIEGRFSNATLTVDGKLVTLRRLDNALASIDSIEQYRLEQTRPGEYNVVIVSSCVENDVICTAVKEQLRALYGSSAVINVTYAADLEPDESGKYTLADTLFPLSINDYLEPRQTGTV